MSVNGASIGKGGFHHLAIRVFDFEKSLKFYIDGLGFKKHISWGEGDERAIMLDTGNDNYLEIFAGGKEGEKPEGAIIHMALRSENCDRDLEKAVSAGAVVTTPPTDVEIPSQPPKKVRIAFCKGPYGEIIEFFQER